MSDKILIIEDDPALAEIFTEIVQGTGLECVTIRNGRDALAYLQSHEAPVVILDLGLPFVSGHELLEFMRQDSRHKGTKILVISADANQTQALEDVADIVLLKPASVDQIMEFTLRLVASSASIVHAAHAEAIDSPTVDD